MPNFPIPPNYGPEYSKKFHALYQDLARSQRVALVPFLLEGVALDPTLMQADRLHPRVTAQPRILDNVWPHLKPLLKPAVVQTQAPSKQAPQ